MGKTGGQTAGVIVGGTIGFLIAGPQGAVVGASIGYSVGTLIDPPDSTTGDIPPMAGYPVQRANKGTPIPIIYGTRKVAGNVIWLGDNHPWNKQGSAGGKGGGGGGGTSESGARRSFLLALSEGPAIVLRVWADKKEITGTVDITVFRGEGLADTGIEALVGEDFANYANTCCVYFDEYEVGRTGALPNFNFEVTTEFDPNKTQIYTVDDLIAINDDTASLDGDYELMNNLDLDVAPYNTDAGWPGLGARSAVGSSIARPLTGTFDGKYHTISNMFQNKDRGALDFFAGFFAETSTADIRNLVVADIEIVETRGFSSGFVGKPQMSTFTNCRVTGTMGTEFIGSQSGGFLGEGSGNTCIRCSASVDQIRQTAAGISTRGGFGGNFGDTITDCYSTGDIKSNTGTPAGSSSLGGFAGNVAGVDNFTNCYAAGEIGYTGSSIGGFTGNGDVATVYDGCYYDTDINPGLAGVGSDGLPDPTGMNSKTTAQLFQRATYVGWDFNMVWEINEGVGYPTHQWLNLVDEPQDSNPSVTIKDLLTNDRYGAGLDESTWLNTATFDTAEDYCNDNGLLFSFNLDTQRPVLDWIDFINGHFQGFIFFSEGKISLGIYKEETAISPGITRDHLAIEEGEDPVPPVEIQKRVTPETANRIEVTWSDRGSNYDTSVAIAMDEVDQRVTGKVRKKTVQLTGITNKELAQRTAYRLLFESLYRFSTYNFVLSYKSMLFEVGDVTTITDGFSLTDEKIRITSISEDKDGRGMAIQAIEDSDYLYEQFVFASQGNEYVEQTPADLVDAAATFTESHDADGLAISIVPGGADTNGWQIYKSFDDATYEFVGQANIDDPAASPTNSTGTTLSNLQAHSAVVYKGDEELLVSIGTVTVLDTAVTDDQFFNNQRLCKIGDEIIAYKTCVQTATAGIWKITGLIRGLFGTEAVAHVPGETFWTINTDFSFVFSEADIGRTIYFKMLTVFGTSIQGLADVTGIPYVIIGKSKRPMPLSLMRIHDREGLGTYIKDEVIVDFYFGSKTAGFNIGAFGVVLWDSYEPDISIQTMNVKLKDIDNVLISESDFDITDIGTPMALLIDDADREGNNPFIVEMKPGSSYTGIGSREITLEKV